MENCRPSSGGGSSRGPASASDADPRPRLLVQALGGLTVVEFVDTPVVLEGHSVRDLGVRLQSLVNEGHSRLLLNLSGVQHASSSALGNLAMLHRRVSESRGFLKLCRLDPALREGLRICRLDSEFEIYENLAEALAAHSRAGDPLTGG